MYSRKEGYKYGEKRKEDIHLTNIKEISKRMWFMQNL